MKNDRCLRSYDTDKDSAIRQIQALQRMNVSDRAEMTFQLSDNLRATVESGIRQRHPGYEQEQITLAVLRLTIDGNLFSRVFPACEIVP